MIIVREWRKGMEVLLHARRRKERKTYGEGWLGGFFSYSVALVGENNCGGGGRLANN
jgi:hypothetical protein